MRYQVIQIDTYKLFLYMLLLIIIITGIYSKFVNKISLYKSLPYIIGCLILWFILKNIITINTSIYEDDEIILS